MTGANPGRGVFVIGMHRSGTSALTRVVNLLGVPTAAPDALKRPSAWNELGFWEVGALSRLNEELLVALGGSWQAPPDLPPGWTQDPRLDPFRERARELFGTAHPSPEWVWKDPRNCLLLPLWLELLGVTATVILTYREPAEVAASLTTRDRLSPRLGLALWERYTRAALQAIDGLPVLVVPYAGLLAAPAEWRAAMLGFLQARGLDCSLAAPIAEAVRFVDPDLRRERSGAPHVSDEQRALFDLLAALPTRSERFSVPALPAATPTTEILLEERRFAANAARDAPSHTPRIERSQLKALRKLHASIERLDALLAGGVSGEPAAMAKQRLRDELRAAAATLDVIVRDEPARDEPASDGARTAQQAYALTRDAVRAMLDSSDVPPPHSDAPPEPGDERLFRRELARRLAAPSDPRLIPDPGILGAAGSRVGGAHYTEDALHDQEYLAALDGGGVLAHLGDASDRPVVWQIGGGSGGLAYRFKRLFPNATYVITDHPTRFLLSATWLMTACPEAAFAFYDGTAPIDWRQADYVFAPDQSIATLDPPSLDLAIATGSFQEMTADQIAWHAARAHERDCRYLYVAGPDRVADGDAGLYDIVARWYWPHPVDLPRLLLRRTGVSATAEGEAFRHIVGWRRVKV